jgi:YNFM family putative membrane transporter
MEALFLAGSIMSAPITQGSPAFRRINRAMVLGGFSVFALLYGVQPLLPVFASQFAVSPAHASWALSLSTATLAVALLVGGAMSDRLGRRPLMAGAMVAGALLTLLCALARNMNELLVLRAALGLALGGMPAVAMAYLSEEVEPKSLGLSMGLYISGSAFGGMVGRMLTSVLTDFFSWRVALATLGAAALLGAWEFWRSLPASTRFRPQAAGIKGVSTHLQDAGLPWLFCIAFLIMGCFVSVYNYIGYRLLAEPFGLRQSLVGALAALYLVGMYSAVWGGRLADRLGRRNVLWAVMLMMVAGLVLTLSNWLPMIVAGMALFTFGFFATHSVASSWVGRRARAPQALAAALYLFFYYIGSSLIGSLTGVVWSSKGWPGVVAVLAALMAAAVLIALRLRSLEPLPERLATA